jgi:hypothetical protein
MTLEVRHDMDEATLVKAFAYAARAEGVDAVLAETLRKSLASEPSPEPESYLRTVVDLLDEQYGIIARFVENSIERWFEDRFGVHKAQRPPGPYLTQEQIDELVSLIRAQFRIALRLVNPRTYSIPPAVEARWRAAGILAPTVRIRDLIDDAYVAGRLYDILENHSTYAAMRAAAQGIRMTRSLELSLGIVRRDVSAVLMRFADERVGEAEVEVNRLNNERVRAVISRYLDGTLRSTPTNRTALTPEEVTATETGTPVIGWRALARELRNRMMTVDADRDWHRVAATETRYAYNSGRLAEMAERGVAYVSWSVQDNACGYCKRLLLEADGTPRRFPMRQVQEVLALTGGTNAGRTPQRIGREGGWLPTAIIHPWCRCVPMVHESH